MSSSAKPPARNLPARDSAIAGTWCNPIDVLKAMIDWKMSRAWSRTGCGASARALPSTATAAASRQKSCRMWGILTEWLAFADQLDEPDQVAHLRLERAVVPLIQHLAG